MDEKKQRRYTMTGLRAEKLQEKLNSKVRKAIIEKVREYGIAVDGGHAIWLKKKPVIATIVYPIDSIIATGDDSGFICNKMKPVASLEGATVIPTYFIDILKALDETINAM